MLSIGTEPPVKASRNRAPERRRSLAARDHSAAPPFDGELTPSRTNRGHGKPAYLSELA